MRVTFIISLCILYNHLVHVNGLKDNYKVELVHVLFRHGDRTPANSERYPTDPYDPTEYQQYGYGQLTTSGMLREYTLGKFLRKRYNDFLGDYYFDNVYGYSTDLYRTKMSLQMVLSGLYPPTPKTRWSKIIKWIPIATDYEPFEINFLSIDVFGVCSPRYFGLFNDAQKYPDVKTKLDRFGEFSSYVQNNTKVNSSALLSINNIGLNVECVAYLGLPLPKWCSQTDRKRFQEMYALINDLFVYTNEMQRLAVGPTVKKILENVDNSENPDNKKRIYLFSGHDVNVATFSRAHNFTGIPSLAAFGSAVIIEKLRGPDAQIYLRMFYWTGVTEKLIPVRVGDCSHECLLSEYVKLISPILPEPGQTMCDISECDAQLTNRI